MKCGNDSCKKIINNQSEIINCNECNNNFCSQNCLTIHNSKFHSFKLKNKDNNSESNVLNSSQNNPFNPLLQSAAPSLSPLSKNIFIKKGKIIENFIDDPLYSLNNFQFVRNPKNNKIVGCGFGSYGQVLLAKNIKNNLLYAIKHIKKEKVLQAKEKIDIIYREIEIQRSLIHPNIIRLYSYKEDKDNFYLIMEYAKKGNLLSKIRKEGKLNENEAFKIFIQVCSSILFLHSNGYAHRDIKPENILIDENNNIKLCDFGLCANVNDGQRTTICGTYEYIAPEIIKEQPYDQSIDIWSLGILLYEMLHGYSPFRSLDNKNDEEYQKEIFKNIMDYKYNIDDKLFLSKECVDMIHKLLEFNCKNRIRIFEIFLHPWVKKFEKIYKGENNEINSSIIETNSKIANDNKIIVNNDDLKNFSYNQNLDLLKNDVNSNLVQGDNVFEKAMKKVSQKKKKVIRSESGFKNKNDDKKMVNIKRIEIDEKKEEKLIQPNLNPLHKDSLDDFSIFRESFLNNPINNNIDNLQPNFNHFNFSNNNVNKFNIQNEKNNNINKHFERSKTDIKNDININKKNQEINNILKNEKTFIESTPTPNDDFSGEMFEKYNKKYNQNDAINAIGLLENAGNINQSQIKKDKKKANLKQPQSFWDKLFSPFKCGILNNNDEKK